MHCFIITKQHLKYTELIKQCGAICRLKNVVANIRGSKDVLKLLSFVVLTNATKVWPIQKLNRPDFFANVC